MSQEQDYDTRESTISGNPPDLNQVPVNKLEPYLHNKQDQDIEDRDMPDTLKSIPRPEHETMRDLQDLKHSFDRKATADVTRNMRGEQNSSYIQ